MTTPRSLSPANPFPASGQPRAPSPNAQLAGPRGSTSSNRSLRRTPEDFEAALLNPAKTLFLSGSPLLENDEKLPGGAGAGKDEGGGVDDRRSFEEDLKGLGLKGTATRAELGGGTTTPTRGTPGRGAGGGGGKFASPGVIPPTPSTIGSAKGRRDSLMTQGSVGSGSVGSPSKKMSVGIDTELHEGRKSSSKHAKQRKSIFRSPGTASSPDLATLVKRAKEAKAQGPAPSSGLATQTPSAVPRVLTKTQNEPGPSSYQPVGTARDRATSYASGMSAGGTIREEEGWNADRRSSVTSREGAGTGAAGPSSDGRRSRQNSEEGFKSMRHKARGMFGKMFGSTSSSRDHTPTTSPATSSSSHFPGSPDLSRPPVPPLPASYAMGAGAQRRVTSPTVSDRGDVFSSPQSPDEAHAIPYPPPLVEALADTRPTDQRRPSAVSQPSTDKPLPPVRDGVSEASVARPPTTNGPGRSSLHVRQPAGDSMAEDDVARAPLPPMQPSPHRQAVATFKQDVAGMFDQIGMTEPAKELGLPPDSLRSKDRSASADNPRDVRALAAELNTATSSGQLRKPPLLSPMPVSQRTSSLPAVPSPSDSPSVRSQRKTSSPNLKLGKEVSLVPDAPTLSRASSSSSVRRRKRQPSAATTTTDDDPALLLASPTDLGPSSESPRDVNATIRGRPPTTPSRNGHDEAPLLPSSVRLVPTPRHSHDADRPSQPAFLPPSLSSVDLARSTFTSWGQQSPRLRDSGAEDGGDPFAERALHSPTTPTLAAPDNRPRQPTEEEDDEEKGRRMACEFLDNDYRSMPADRVAEFLGGPRAINGIALRYYMQYFDMKGQNLVDAFRDLCQKLHLKAESQEIDRILDAWSVRYYECNPNTVFGTPGVVHTVTGAMLMLNTDLHIADLAKHMSRSEFVRNAMRAIQESMPVPARESTPDLVRDDRSTSAFGSTQSFAGPPAASVRAKPTASQPAATPRSASAPVIPQSNGATRRESDTSIPTAASAAEMKHRASSTTVASSFTYSRSWEAEAENALKEIYSAVRADRILLPTAGAGSTPSHSNRQSVISLASSATYDVGRRGTVRSPSGGKGNGGVNAFKRGSVRSMGGLLNNPYGQSDGRLSPTPSYATSINDGFSQFQPTIGFASNLSHTVIREHDDEIRSQDSSTSLSTLEDLDEDELALLGAPWAKEGMLWRKTVTEAGGKKPRKDSWKQYFVVIQKGELHMFTFGAGKSGSFGGGSVGGGNWLNNANSQGSWNLMHATAMQMPKPGLRIDRAHCFSLSFPTGEQDFLQAGTDDLVIEWVATINYWAARKSRQPLQGGVSNMEYGWQRVQDAAHAGGAADDDRASVRSGRSGMSKLSGIGGGGASYGRRGFGGGGQGRMDKVYINEWKPPMPATMPSPLDEESQLEALQAYVRSLAEELESHKAVEVPMSALYSHGSKNWTKARDNWTAKSRYIHTEIYKYETYVEALRHAIALRVKKQGEKKLEKSLQRSTTSLRRRSSANAEQALGKDQVAEAKSGERGENGRGLRIDMNRHAEAGGEDGEDEDEDEVVQDGDDEDPATPSASNFRGITAIV